ncbi:GNAT family N-acetyltransferase [Abyssibacter sp.]|jgi:hypothetical protein|uniref:GNAT family N-acetyltransferase n=1 Tax=Abyssibacter sp. TaxID=2320200 RepID=UPI000C41ACFC|nr:GNAT family N-acetyltransferase [Abyssibacter sp.]MBB86834.1 GNAT family N-acetyltransferase [Xanthomonadales bacterium]MCK5859099.1 N-acetyltransferase [Abyssibacter sp.]
MSSSDEITLQQPDYTVQHEATPIGGRYYIPLDGTRAFAELTWRRRADGNITADHTYVPGSWRGHGLAHRLVERLMNDAAEQGCCVVPACSYVLAEARRNPAWQALTLNCPS